MRLKRKKRKNEYCRIKCAIINAKNAKRNGLMSTTAIAIAIIKKWCAFVACKTDSIFIQYAKKSNICKTKTKN